MDSTRRTVIFMLLGTLILSLPTLLLVDVPKANETFLNIVLGWFIAKGSDAVGYLINSTQDSSVKTKAVIDMASNGGQPPLAQVLGPDTTATVTTGPAPDDFAIPAKPI